MSENSPQEEFDLIGNILAEENKNNDFDSPCNGADNVENQSPDNKKSIKL